MLICGNFRLPSTMNILGILLLLGCAFCVPIINQVEPYPKKTTSPIYIKKHDKITSYETTAKFLLKIQLPKVEILTVKPEDANSAMGMIVNKTNMMWQDYTRYVQRFGTSPRKKRQIFVAAGAIALGYEIHSMYSFFQRKFGTDQEAEESINNLRKALAQNQHEFLLFEHEVKEFSDQVTTTLEKFSLKFYRLDLEIKALLHMSEVQFTYFKVQQGIDRCFDNQVPASLIPQPFLLEKLSDLQTEVLKYGYHVAIDIKNLYDVSHMKIADCLLTTEYLYVLVNIPVRKTDWQITEVLPIPFNYQGHTCQLEAPKSQIMAVYGSSLKEIDTTMTRYCNFLNDKLCLVPEFSRPSSQTNSCIRSLFNQAGMTELDNSCKFECDVGNELMIKEVDAGKIIVTHAKQIYIACPDGYKNFSAPAHGSLEINIICNCTYSINGEIYYGSASCLAKGLMIENVVHLVTEFSKFLDDRNIKIKSMYENIPKFNYTIPFNTPLPGDTYIGSLHYQDFWLTLMSGICLCLIVVGVFSCYCFFKYR